MLSDSVSCWYDGDGTSQSPRIVKSKQSSQSKRWSSWHAGADDGEDYEIDESYYPEYAAIPEEYEAHEYDDAPAAEEDVEYEYDEEAATETGADSAAASSPQSSADVLLEVANALTVTSQRLAEITKARGYYNVKGGSGKSKGKSKSIKGKGKPKGKPSSKGNGKGGAAPASFCRQGTWCTRCHSLPRPTWTCRSRDWQMRPAWVVEAQATG